MKGGFDWAFIPGLELSAAFYDEAVRPALQRIAPDLRYAAARIDRGSDVLGFDTPQSMDHGWGPRLTIFLEEQDFERHAELHERLGHELPLEVRGIPTNFASPRLIDDGLKRIETGPVQHGVAITTIRRFFREYIGFDPRDGIGLIDWLTVPSQRLRTLASGRVFHDSDGGLERLRDRLRWYPHEVWLYLMASQWRRIGQEEALMARAGDAGDDLGSAIIASRLSLELIRLAFLQEREHVPYSKWVGTAFARLPIAASLAPPLEHVPKAVDWRAREQHLTRAYRVVAERHNQLEVTPSLDVNTRPFHERPYQVIDADRFAEAIEAEMHDDAVRALPHGVGAVWQFVDSTDVLDEIERCRMLAVVYGRGRS